MSVLSIRRLTLEDAPVYRKARLAALLADPSAFVTTAEQFASWPVERLAHRLAPDAPGLTLGAFQNSELVGLLTLMREDSTSQAHRANVLSVSVAPAARGQGIGEALLHAAVAEARAFPGVTSLHLTVMNTQVAARRLYERCGFRVWGIQPDAISRDGQVHEERWMWLPLRN